MPTVDDNVLDPPPSQDPAVKSTGAQQGQDPATGALHHGNGDKISPISTPQLADDSDLIEDEWVDIVRKIVEDNRSDPYNLSKAMTALRADYMKKRYNKDIKIPD